MLPSLLGTDGGVIDIDPSRTALMRISRTLGFEEVERRYRHGVEWSIRRLRRDRCRDVAATDLMANLRDDAG
jgi:hypothetical protein